MLRLCKQSSLCLVPAQAYPQQRSPTAAMASNTLPIPAPPRTPTPPSDDDRNSAQGLGLGGGLGTDRSPSIVSQETANNPYPSQTLAPSTAYDSFSSTKSTPIMAVSPALSTGSLTTPYETSSGDSAIVDDTSTESSMRTDSNGPFRFQTRVYTPALDRSPKKSVCDHTPSCQRGCMLTLGSNRL